MAAAILVLYVLTKILSTNCIKDDREGDVTKRENFIFWADGIIPFFIDPRHFDTDQQLAITSALVKFSFKTCLQFKPVLEEPMPDKHVLVLENPHGIRKCVINTKGHAVDEPHRVTIGFDCMTSPHIDMMMMRALGFPFEHNRASRDIYIDILFQNVDQGAIELYTKEQKLPIELRALPYDVNSVLHFSNREYSKNGHRTFIFKNPNTYQNRVGLSPTDLQKINIIYGPECKTRDRFAKLKICSNYPANKRRKREVHSENNKTNVLLEFDNKTETSFSIGEEQNVSNILQEAEKNLRTLPLKSEENNSEQLIKEFNFEGKNIARQNNVDNLILDLVRKIRQVRRLSIALAKKKNKSTRTGTTDEDIALTLVNLLYTSLKDTAATEDKLDSDIKSVRSSSKEKYKDKQLYSTKFLPAQDKTDENGDNESAGSDFEKMKRSKIRKKVKGEQFYSTRNRPARGETYESGKSASAENDYATKKTEKSKFGKKVKGEQFYSTRFRPAGGEIDESGKTASADIDYATEKIVKTKIRPVYASTQFRNIFPYTQYSIGREKVSKEETSSAKQKREVNMIGEGSDKVSTTPHNGPIENITLNKDTRRTFMDR